MAPGLRPPQAVVRLQHCSYTRVNDQPAPDAANSASQQVTWQAAQGTQVRDSLPHRETPSDGSAGECPLVCHCPSAPLHRCQLRTTQYGAYPVGRKGYNRVNYSGDRCETLCEQGVTTQPVVHISTGSRKPSGTTVSAGRQTVAGSRETGMPLSTEVPLNGSIASWSARMLLFTPARSAATRMLVPGCP